jgi:hypothetical protein
LNIWKKALMGKRIKVTVFIKNRDYKPQSTGKRFGRIFKTAGSRGVETRIDYISWPSIMPICDDGCDEGSTL